MHHRKVPGSVSNPRPAVRGVGKGQIETTVRPEPKGRAVMTTQTAVSTPSRTCTPAQRVTRSLLGYGVLAGTVFEVSILIQGLTRHGFRIAHDDASLLANGPLGWIQVATFLVAGAMTIAGAIGMRRALADPGPADP